MRNWKLMTGIAVLHLIGVVIYLFVVNTVRIPEVGDRYVYRDNRGDAYTFEVTEKDAAAKTLEITGRGNRYSFYDLDLTFSYRSRWLEWTYMKASGRGTTYTCDLKRGEGGFLMYPVKRLFGRPREFGFRANCTEEGAFTYQTRVEFGGREKISTQAGSFSTFKIGHTVSFPLQNEQLGSLTFHVSPKIGFLAKFDVTINDTEGVGQARNAVDTFELVQYLPARTN